MVPKPTAYLLKVVNSIETPLDIHWRIVFCSNFEFNTLIDDSVLIFGDTMQHQAIESAVNIIIGIEDDHPNIENFRERMKPLLRHWLPRNMPGNGGQRVRRYQWDLWLSFWWKGTLSKRLWRIQKGGLNFKV